MGSYVTTEEFDWNPERRIFVAEISMLPREFSFSGLLGEGFTMVSKKTGAFVPFAFSSVDKSGGEIAGWRFTPTADYLQRNPAIVGVSALIIND